MNMFNFDPIMFQGAYGFKALCRLTIVNDEQMDFIYFLLNILRVDIVSSQLKLFIFSINAIHFFQILQE